MPFARAIMRGFFLNDRLAVKGSQKASRSFGAPGSTDRAALDCSMEALTDERLRFA